VIVVRLPWSFGGVYWGAEVVPLKAGGEDEGFAMTVGKVRV
jgi:hypothetical protein